MRIYDYYFSLTTTHHLGCRSDRKEGGQDTSDGYGHAGEFLPGNMPFSVDSVYAQLWKVTIHASSMGGFLWILITEAATHGVLQKPGLPYTTDEHLIEIRARWSSSTSSSLR